MNETKDSIDKESNYKNNQALRPQKNPIGGPISHRKKP